MFSFDKSIRAVQRSGCFHAEGHDAKCIVSNYGFMVIFACIQIVLSQIPNFHKLWWLSIVAAVMSFAYSSIGLALSIARIAGSNLVKKYHIFLCMLIADFMAFNYATAVSFISY